MRTRQRLVAALTAATFASGCLAQAAPPAPEPAQVEGKFAWGLLLKLVAPYVFDYFAAWAKKKITASLDTRALERLTGNAALASVVSLNSYLTSRDIVLGGAGAPPNAMPGEPEATLVSGKEGENFQGVNVALVGVDKEGAISGFRNVADGFSTGERFKLRVLSTFDAVVVLGNITPRGARRQIYPASVGQAVSIPAGKEILLPLGKAEYLQFAGDVGRDQLTLTVRDPRSLTGGQSSTARVFRRDEDYGSNFVQEVKPGRYPVIAEAIGIEHK